MLTENCSSGVESDTALPGAAVHKGGTPLKSEVKPASL